MGASQRLVRAIEEVRTVMRGPSKDTLGKEANVALQALKAEMAGENKALSGEQELRKIKEVTTSKIEMGRAKTEDAIKLKREASDIKQMEAIAREEAKAQAYRNQMKLADDARQAVDDSISRISSRLPSQDSKLMSRLAELEASGDAGKVFAGGLKAMVNDAETRYQGSLASSLRDRFVQAGRGEAPPEATAMLDTMLKAPTPEIRDQAKGAIDGMVKQARRDYRLQQAQTIVRQRAAEAGGSAGALGMLEEMVKGQKSVEGIRKVADTQIPKIERTAKNAKAVRAGLLGAGAAGGAAILAKSLFGDKEDEQPAGALTPGMKMQLMLESIKAQGKQNQPSEELETGRTINNMSKLLQLITALRASQATAMPAGGLV